MNIVSAFVAGSLLLLAVQLQAAEPDSEPAAVMADIVATMNHFPSDEQKATLAGIAGDSQVDENLRAIAEVIAGVQHQPSGADRQKLQEIADDDSASDEARTLAGALLRFEHKAASQDVAALDALSE